MATSDTSLIFNFIPVDLGVNAAMAKMAASTMALNRANAASVPTMQKVGAESNRMSTRMLAAAESGNKVRRSWLGLRRAAIDVEKAETRINKAFASMGNGAQRTARDIERGSRRIGQASAVASREIFNIDNHVRHVSRRWLAVFAIIGAIVVALVGHFVAFADAVWQSTHALAAVPALAFGAAVGLGSLFLVFKNLFGALHRTGGGGNAVDQLAAATHRLEQAQRSAADAQRALNDAREEAARKLADMDRELRKADLDERSAALAVREARQALKEARQSGDRDERERAQIAYEQALIALDETKESTADLRKEEAERAEKGVEGSDEVQQALERQRDALYELAQAQKELARGGGGGADSAALAYAKLSENGKALVDTLRSLAPAWSSVQKQVQNVALAGVAEDVKGVSGVLLAQRGHLLGIGAAWNTALRGLLGYFKSEKGAAALNVTLGNTVLMSQHLARAWEPFVRGFMTWLAASSDVLPRFGAWIEKLANQFAEWAQRSADSGKFTQWINDGVKAAKELGHWIRDLWGGLANIFHAGDKPNYLADLADDTKRWREAMASPEMQTTLAHFFEASRAAGSALWAVLKALTDLIIRQPDLVKEAAGAFNIIAITLRVAADNAAFFNTVLPPLITAFILYKTYAITAKVATLAWSAAMTAATVASRLLGLAGLSVATGPLALIIIGVIALVAAFILLWNKFEGFRDFWKTTWQVIQDAPMQVWHWLTGDFLDFWKNLPGKIGSLLGGLGETLKSAFKVPINWIVDKINGLVDAINFVIRTYNRVQWGADVRELDHIPHMAKGGVATRAGLAMVGEEGPEILSLPRGASVTPLSRASGKDRIVVEIDIRGDDELARWLRKAIRVRGARSFGLAAAT